MTKAAGDNAFANAASEPSNALLKNEKKKVEGAVSTPDAQTRFSPEDQFVADQV